MLSCQPQFSLGKLDKIIHCLDQVYRGKKNACYATAVNKPSNQQNTHINWTERKPKHTVYDAIQPSNHKNLTQQFMRGRNWEIRICIILMHEK